ncbi:ornithine cyclodeaminase [Ancylobacter oerskovii]|uniref:Ornithine cyclodeaminase n=1 Tax=Ancylobacter oerskovii TaxID=459519 RepID=A0ABW4Z152_9HYPH|nr:ornithine cyclodeaminase [Ancylobacter oerskovii]
MVRYIGVENVTRLVRAIGVEPYLVGLSRYIEDDFRRWPRFDKVPRIASHSPDGVIELMPTSDGTLYGFKYVNGHPANTLAGLQTVTGFGVLADVATGYPQLLAEMTVTTALRTAATSALAARYLARPEARTMALIGLGSQAEFQALGFHAINGIDRLRVFDIDEAATAKFLANMDGRDLVIEVARSAEAAVEGADIITTVTADKRRATILSDNMVGAGVHINAVGGDCPGKTELQREILMRADIFVELPEQTRVEGEIQQLAPDHPVTELWRVIAGEVPGRRSREQITLFDSVGFAIEDFAALRHLRDLADETGFYQDIDLIPAPRDPRNLFGLISATDHALAPLEA